MKFRLLCPILALAISASLGAQENKPAPAAAPAAAAAPAPAPKADPLLMDKVSYFIGSDLAATFKRLGYELKPELVVEGLKDAAAGKKEGKYTQQELQAAMETVQQAMMEKQREEMMKMQEEAAKAEAELAKSGPKNKEAGEKFLAENKKKEGVTATASGLQYEILKKADGPKPKATDTVTVHYHGTLLDGSVFDSSVERGEPIQLPLNRVIPGWTEGVQLMPVGSKFKFFIPSNLAYGEQAQPPKIGPNSTLIFEVELIAIDDAAAAGKPQE